MSDSDRYHFHVAAWARHLQEVNTVYANQLQLQRARTTEADSRLRAATELFDAKMPKIQALIADRYKTAPDAGMIDWIQSGVVADAEEHRRKAYASRGAAMRHVWHIEQIHHTSSSNSSMCACGISKGKCRTWQAQEGFREQLDRWEQKNLSLLRQYKNHDLPRDHPEVESRSRRYSCR